MDVCHRTTRFKKKHQTVRVHGDPGVGDAIGDERRRESKRPDSVVVPAGLKKIRGSAGIKPMVLRWRDGTDLFPVGEAVFVRVAGKRVRRQREDFFSIQQSVCVGIEIVRIGTQSELGGIGQPVKVRVDGVGARSGHIEFVGVRKAVAVGVDAGAESEEGGLLG